MKKSILVLVAVVFSSGFASTLRAGYYDAPMSSYAVQTAKNPMGSRIALSGIAQDNPCNCFDPGAWNFDVIGARTWGQDTERLDGWGGGIQATTFYNEIFGVGTRALWWDGELNVQHDYSASAYLRYPVPDLCIAPYFYGGGGLRTNGSTFGTGHLGAGIDIRLSRMECVGIFIDYRHTWTAQNEENYNQLSVGLRLSY